MANIDIGKYKIDASVLLDVASEKVADANIYQNKQIKQQMQLIAKLLNTAFCAKEVSCEKVLEVGGQLYCAIKVEKENSLLDDGDGFEENAIQLIDDLNSASNIFAGLIVANDFDGADKIANKYSLSNRPIDIAEYSNARMLLEEEVEIQFKNNSIIVQPMERCNLDIEIDSPPEAVIGGIFCGYTTGNKLAVQLISGENLTLEYRDSDKDYIKSITYSEEMYRFQIIRKRSRYLKNKKSDFGKLVSISKAGDVPQQSAGLFQNIEN